MRLAAMRPLAVAAMLAALTPAAPAAAISPSAISRQRPAEQRSAAGNTPFVRT